MSHQVGKVAAAEIPEKAPAAVFHGVEGLVGSGAQEFLPLGPAGIDLRFHILPTWPDVILVPVHFGKSNLPETSALHQFLGDEIVVPTALLRSGGDDALRFL